MTSKIYFLLLSFGLFMVSCGEKKVETPSQILETELISTLPFKSVTLKDMSDFEETSKNWKVSGATYVDRSKNKTLLAKEGSGILVNNPEENVKGNLTTTFKHGDIEFECDIMMPVQSNSGIYFQSRYEIQLFDSWGVNVPEHSDMGGVYQRWDETKDAGKEGLEGFAPRINASKSPGLWQHLSVVFHAPKFDESGNKIKNAWFEEVRLNGAVIHKNIEVSGPTRGGLEIKEVPEAPLSIQGDHGPVAFRNIKYKLFGNQKVTLNDVHLKEYENVLSLFPNLDSLVPIHEIQTDSISALMATGIRPQKLLLYEGKLRIPETGDYIFEYKLNRAGGALLIDKDTVISMNGNYTLDSLRIAKITLNKGTIPFQLIYNKHVPWQIGFGLYVEGPGIQKHPLHAVGSLNLPSEEINADFLISVGDEPLTQRGFWMHEGKKRTHCIAVGSPKGIHYSYDLEKGSLLQAWNGDFMDATKMWQGRGEKQLGRPAGFIVSFPGDPELAILNNENDVWPSTVLDRDYKQLGYKFGTDGLPSFSYEIEGSKVVNEFIPLTKNRGLKRKVGISGSKSIWFKIADGHEIQKLPDGTFIVNNESYFIDFESSGLEPKIRKSGDLNELMVKVPSGEQQIEYSIIW